MVSVTSSSVRVTNNNSESVVSIPADFLVVGAYSTSTWTTAASALDKALGGLLTRLAESGDISGKQGELVTILAPQGIKAQRVLIVGLGARDQLNSTAAFRATSAAAKRMADKKRHCVAYFLNEGWSADVTEAALCGTLIGCVGQDIYRTERKLHPPEEVTWVGAETETLVKARELAESVNFARRLVNEPPNELYPETFADIAETTGRENGFEVETWDERRLQAERCGALIAVARGSARPPRLVIMKYAGGTADQPWLGLVGKGVTFDSGGLSIKPTDGMKTMKCDMAGAATVLGAMRAIARLKLPVNVLGFAGLVENMLSGESYKVGDVLRARSGKTIEVLNTDAEGRLVLADVLDVAAERGVSKIIDLATLTGACVVALGTDVVGAMTNDQEWCDTVLEAARICGESVWQLPMFSEFADEIKSDVADIKNTGNARWGGAITAGKFLEESVGGKPWVHLDIAGPAFLDSAKPWLDAGGTGTFVRTLVQVARDWC